VAVAATGAVAVGGASVAVGAVVGATVGSGVGVSLDPQLAIPAINTIQSASQMAYCLSVEYFIVDPFNKIYSC
jgi:hypothetical protein